MLTTGDRDDAERHDRAHRLAALGDPARLAITDELAWSDRSPVELRRRLGIESNLLAHHLDVLERAGLITRSRSSGDGRRRYIRLVPHSFAGLLPVRRASADKALFVCSHNSARSQLAAALWRSVTGRPADSAGTHPARRVHPGALAAARRAGLDLSGAVPTSIDDVTHRDGLVITVCDQAHEELDPDGTWLHWSIPDPVADGSAAAFDATVDDLRARITALVPTSQDTP